jgi:hypothetical protein
MECEHLSASFQVGRSNIDELVKTPVRLTAGSIFSGWFVAAMTKIPFSEQLFK